jgi:transposase
MGLLLKALVLPANLTDRDGGADLVEKAKAEHPSLRHLFVDGGYRGKWARWVRDVIGWSVEVIQRRKIYARGIWWPNDKPLPDWYFAAVEAEKGFKALPRRWVVERTFAWLSFQRRLNRDYDLLPKTTEAYILVATCRLMIRRLAS